MGVLPVKKYIVLIVLIVSLLSYSHFFTAKKKSAEEASSKKILRVGVECEYVPNSWEENKPSSSNLPIVNYDGSYAEGYDIQIAKIVAAEIGADIQVWKIAWNDLIPALRNGEIDVIFSSMLDTEERKKLVAFSESYEAARAEYAIIVDSVGPYISATSLKDFSGARIIGEKGTMLDSVIDQIPGVIHLKPVETINGIVDCVLREEADGAVIDVDTGHFHELMNKGLTLIKFPENKGFELGFTGVCAAVRKGDDELRHKINIALSGISRTERRDIMDTVTSRMMNAK